MKIIRSIVPVLVCLFTSGLLHAQEQKTDLAKPLEVKIAAAAGNKTSPQPEAKLQPQEGAAQVPSTSASKAQPQPQAQEKLEVKTFNKNDLATPGGEEGVKIMTGTTSRPKDPVSNPSTIDPKPAPQLTKSVKSNQQQQ